MVVPFRLMVLATFVLVAAAVVVSAAREPVSRARLERFARRQRLTVTVGNGEQVIRYLATTRRWRTTGLVGGAATSIAWSLPDAVTVDFVSLFTGWFLGALIAEVRVDHLSFTPRRAASLRERRPGTYLSRAAWALVPMTAAMAIAVAAGTGVAAALGDATPGWAAWAWLGVALALAAVIRFVQLRVLRRPQPLTEPDVLAADDAIRSRSLHVLAGGGAAIVLYCVSAQLGELQPVSSDIQDFVTVIRALGVFVVAALGWNVATTSWPPRRRASGTLPGPSPTGAA